MGLLPWYFMKCFWKQHILKYSKIKMLINRFSIGATILCQLKCPREKETPENQFYILQWVLRWERGRNPISPKGRLVKNDLTARSACKRMQLIRLSSCHVVRQANSIIESITVSHTDVMVWSIPSAASGFLVWKVEKKPTPNLTWNNMPLQCLTAYFCCA